MSIVQLFLLSPKAHSKTKWSAREVKWRKINSSQREIARHLSVESYKPSIVCIELQKAKNWSV
jgi:hypothetical protein